MANSDLKPNYDGDKIYLLKVKTLNKLIEMVIARTIKIQDGSPLTVTQEKDHALLGTQTLEMKICVEGEGGELSEKDALMAGCITPEVGGG